MDALTSSPGFGNSHVLPRDLKAGTRAAGFPEWPRLAIKFRLLFLLALLCLVNGELGAQQRPTDIQVQAAYLYNFGKFVTWQGKPEDDSESMEICVLGKSPFGGVLDETISGESINGKKIIGRKLDSIQDGPECKILFVSSSEQKRLRVILPTARRLGMLTVSDIPHFAQLGGVIEFVSQDDRIRFEVNLEAAGQSHLILSSQLLKVASKVIPEPPAAQP